LLFCSLGSLDGFVVADVETDKDDEPEDDDDDDDDEVEEAEEEEEEEPGDKEEAAILEEGVLISKALAGKGSTKTGGLELLHNKLKPY